MDRAVDRVSGFTKVPLIDVREFTSGAADALSGVASAVDRASREVGFFYITGHGVPENLIQACLHAAQRFFALPPAAKEAVRVDSLHRGYVGPGAARMYSAVLPDLKESFVWGLELAADDPLVTPERSLMGPNRWPPEPAEMRAALSLYFERILTVGWDLARVFAVALGEKEEFFVRHFAHPLARGGVIHYPPQPRDAGADQFGVGPHTDYGFLTLLWQDANGGLEVMNAAGDWVAAPPVEGSLVVNVGDLLARWSNGRFASTPHRVVNRSGRERFSIPVFYDPDWETVIDPAPVAARAGIPARYPAVVAGEHIRARFDRAFSHRGRGGQGETAVDFQRR